MRYLQSGILPLLFLTFTFQLSAQREETVLGERGWGFSGLWGGYTHQYTTYDQTDGWNRGGFFGFEFGKTLNVGWSRSSLRDEIVLTNRDNRRFDFDYNGGKLGYAFAPYRAIHPVLNFEVGRGVVKIEGLGKDQVFVMQPSAGVEINVFRWFRLGLEGGYRMVRNYDLGADLSEDRLSGAYGQATLKFGFSWGRHHKRPDDSEPASSSSKKEQD